MRKLLITLVFSVLYFVVPGFLCAQPKKIAVLVGVDRYVKLTDLQYPKNDVEKLRDTLLRIGFERKNVFCLVRSDMPEDVPTRRNILRDVRFACELAKTGDTLLVVLSGHGIETVPGKQMFCPQDADDSDRDTTMLLFEEVYAQLEKCVASNKLMIVDACRTHDVPLKAGAKSTSNIKTLDALPEPPKGCALLQSCNRGQKSLEDPDAEHGVFSRYVIEGLAGEAADKDGNITLGQFFNYVRENTLHRARAIDRSIQSPQLSGDASDFLLARIIKTVEPKPISPFEEPLPPDIKFVSPTKSGEVDGDNISFEVLITDKGGGIKKPHVTLNDVVIKIRTEPVSTGNTLRWKFSLPLIEGENVVAVHSATADGQIACQSMPMALHKRRQETVLPSLFMLAIGISDYGDGDAHDLPYARTDAEALAEVFQRRGTEFYGDGKVNVRTLLDKQATSEGIKTAMKGIAAAAKPEDVFVLYIAGHGATGGSLYHFFPYESKFEGDTVDNLVKKHGIPNDVLSDWTSEIPALKRVFIYDTCQSGAAITQSSMERRKALASFLKMTGGHMIAAAGGNEVAMELPNVGHSAITYALLAGLGEAKNGILKQYNAVDGDGIIRTRDWIKFACEYVPMLTKMSFGTEQRVVGSTGESNFPLLGRPVKP